MRACLAEEHGQDPGVVAPEDTGFSKVRSAEYLPAHEDGDVVAAHGVIPSVQHPGGAGGVRGLSPSQLHPKRQGANAILPHHPHLQRSLP